MSEPRHIPEPGETIQSPSPSWAPALFALGALGAVVGIYANGFAFTAFVWSYIGLIIMFFAFRAIVKGAVRSYFSLPRRQHARPATLPIDQITLEGSPADAPQNR
ncbi:MAG: hypothetical protein QM729_15730 [Solirubrobacterales bacterium]